jgi:hypothetical protein
LSVVDRARCEGYSESCNAPRSSVMSQDLVEVSGVYMTKDGVVVAQERVQ